MTTVDENTLNQNTLNRNTDEAADDQPADAQAVNRQTAEDEAAQEAFYSRHFQFMETGFWNLVFVIIIYSYVANVIIPSFGDNENLKFSRLGLLCEIIGLMSLAPDYFGEAIKKLDKPKEDVAGRAEEQRHRFFRFRKVLDHSVLEPNQNAHLSFVHFTVKVIICLFVGYRWYFYGDSYSGEYPLLAWVVPALELICALWIVLGIMNFIYKKLRWVSPITVTTTFRFVDSVLSLPFYLPTWVGISLMNYFLSSLMVTKKVSIETLLLKLAIPFVVVGTILEFYATYK
jgi:hypothetical protein